MKKGVNTLFSVKNKKLAREVVSWMLGNNSNDTGGETQEQITKTVFLSS